MRLSVIVPTHNPDSGRLRRTLQGLRGQSLPPDSWEAILVDNASTARPSLDELRSWAPANLRLVSEPEIGLTQARRRGFSEASGTVFVLVDDDNVLAPDYLVAALDLLEKHPRVGLLGGRSVPEFEREPEAWLREFHTLLALRDLGERRLVSNGFRDPANGRNAYPPHAPIGAGMVCRAEVAKIWLQALKEDARRLSFDRRGASLVSGGDNDLVMTGLEADWEVAYEPALSLRHLIPARRLEPDYLARLNFSMQKSWMRVLTLHNANPWAEISRTGCELRRLRAWLRHRPWAGPVQRIRYAGACGHFEGRIRTPVA